MRHEDMRVSSAICVLLRARHDQLQSRLTDRAPRQVFLRRVGDALKIGMARVAKVGRAKAEKHSHRAAVPTLVLEVVGPVLRAHLRHGHVAARATHQLLGVVAFVGRRCSRLTVPVAVVNSGGGCLATGLAAKVRLVTLEAHVVSVPIHGVPRRVEVEPASRARHAATSVIQYDRDEFNEPEEAGKEA